jgi:threonine aldolase
MRSFGSDNNSGAHPRMLAAIAEANVDHAIAYGDDDGHDVPKTSFEKCWTETTSIRFSCSTELEQMWWLCRPVFNLFSL